MKRLLALAIAFPLVASSRAAEFKLGQHTFTLPDGFTIEVAAPSSLVPRPIEADFDEQGRLYVTDSSGSNDNVRKQLAEKPHRVLRLEDSDGDGVFDKSVVFADKMMFPEGALWHDGSLYVSAPPSIWKLTDTDNDGVADERVEWYQGKSLGGCANDLHGPYLGPDGWIYWCKGGFERQTNILGNGKTFVSSASHIYRARPDGSGLEPIMTGGMDNPVGLAWSPEGELFLSGTFFQHPAGGKRDGLIHVIYGGVYGKENPALDGHPRTGDLLPIMTHLGPAAPVGLARYESSVFGADYQDNLFCCQFNLHKISRHILVPDGSTFRTRDSDFLVSDNPDFHPTDVFEDADGSLIVIDTGGWYKLCCPTSQLHKPDVLGAIYRIRRKDTRLVHNPRGPIDLGQASPKELIQYLDDNRPFVVKRSITALARHGTNAVPALADFLKLNVARDSEKFETQRRNAVWALTRIDGAESRLAAEEVFRALTGDSLRVAALNSAALRRTAVVAAAAKFSAGWPRPHVRRAAFATLGRIRGPISPEFASSKDDPALQHALIHALIQRGDTKELERALVSTNAHAHRAALIALDQMPGGNLKPEQVTPLLASTNALLKQTANWIVSHHPEWAGALAAYFQRRLPASLSDAERAELEGQLAQFAKDASIQSLLAGAACSDNASKEARLSALRAMARARPKETPALWSRELAHSLDGSDVEIQRQVVATARALPVPKEGADELTTGLLRAAANPLLGPQARLNALAAVPGGLKAVEPPTFDFLLAQLAPDKSVALRESAASVLTKARLDAAQLSALAASLSSVGPLELSRLLSAFARANDEVLGLKLIDSLQQSKARSSLRPETLRPNLTNFPATVRAKADAFLATINIDAGKQKTRLDELSLNLKSGDVRRGQAIFNSQKTACSTCHAIGYLGGNLGPDLTKISTIRTERDLLEAVVFPSASFVRSYEPMLVVTKSGDEHSGILRKDAPDEVVLGTGVGTEVRIPRAEVADLRPGTVSVMPAGLDEQLTREELADLMAFLKATRW